MWIFTKEGFFSAVNDKYCGQEEIMVRARMKAHLVALLGKLGGNPDEIIEISHADYRFRARITKDMWAKYLAGSAYGINYANVKDTLGTSKEIKRAMASCWAALFNMQTEVHGHGSFMDAFGDQSYDDPCEGCRGSIHDCEECMNKWEEGK